MRLGMMVVLGALALFHPEATANAEPRGAPFRHCPVCPLLVTAPAGSFLMGAAANDTPQFDDQKPQHKVTIAKAVAIGLGPVTRGEYEAFARETRPPPSPGCSVFDATTWQWKTDPDRSWRAPGFEQTADDPVVCVSWNEAQQYLAWLNAKAPAAGARNRYRLLTEAEWEYAARAGATTLFWWGDEPSHERANYGAEACCGPFAQGADKWLHTSPVGAFAANPFGLRDMTGNVNQWVEDCHHPSYEGAPADGSSWTSGACAERIVRGGSWVATPRALRPSGRERFAPDVRTFNIGFRVARDQN